MPRWLFAALLCASFDASAAVTLESPRFLSIAPGARASYVLSIANTGAERSASTVVVTWGFFPSDGYTLALPPASPCGALSPGNPAGTRGSRFSAPALEPGQRVECAIDVARAASSRDDATLAWRIEAADGRALAYAATSVGTFADVAVALRPLRFSIDAAGVAHGAVQVVAENRGATAVRPFEIGACTDGQWFGFDLDRSFRDGCDVGFGALLCFDSSRGIRLPALTPGQRHVCEVRLDGTEPYDGPRSVPLLLYGLARDPDGGLLIDAAPGNNSIALALGPLPPVAVAVPASRLGGLAALIAALALAALYSTHGTSARRVRG